MKWFKLEEKLPKEVGMTYLVANKKGVDTDVFDGTEFIKFDKQVTHWMKLPKAPK